MFWRYGGSFFGTMTDTNKWAKMYQDDGPYALECVINQDCWFSGETKYADIILPACTNLERNDVGEFSVGGGYTTHAEIANNWRVIVREMKCVEPVGESKSDYEIFTLVSDKLGLGESYIPKGKGEDDWAEGYWNLSELSKRMTWQEFCKKGYYHRARPPRITRAPRIPLVLRGPGTATPRTTSTRKSRRSQQHEHHGGHRQVSKELGTYSGKIEFASESLKKLSPDDDERPPVPHYIPSWEGPRDGALQNVSAPDHLPAPALLLPHRITTSTPAGWTRYPCTASIKDGYAWWPARINPKDAEDRGIKNGDLVELYNDRASVVCVADVTHRVPVGVMHSYGCSAKYDPVVPVPGATDRGGCINLLTSGRWLSKNAPGMAPNSCLIECRKWEG